VGAQHAFAYEAASLGDALRCNVVWAAREFDTREADFVERPTGDKPYGMRGHAASASLRSEPVADGGTSLVEFDTVKRGAA
jgi:hypothetical protein